jgi:hypothetical protein
MKGDPLKMPAQSLQEALYSLGGFYVLILSDPEGSFYQLNPLVLPWH